MCSLLTICTFLEKSEDDKYRDATNKNNKWNNVYTIIISIEIYSRRISKF